MTLIFTTVAVNLNFVSDALVICHLPDGPTAHFKLSGVRRSRNIKVGVSVYLKLVPNTLREKLYMGTKSST